MITVYHTNNEFKKKNDELLHIGLATRQMVRSQSYMPAQVVKDVAVMCVGN